MSGETPGQTTGQTPDMAPGQKPAAHPFAMVGDADAPVCVDGVCEVPPSTVDRAAPAEDTSPPGPDPS